MKRSLNRRTTLLLLAVGAFAAPLTLPGSANAAAAVNMQPIQNLADLNRAFVRIAESATPSVVTIYTETTVDRPSPFPSGLFSGPFAEFFGRQAPDQGNGAGNGNREVRRGLGSGVIVGAEGYILTSNHVIDGADTISITTWDNRKIPARVVGKDPRTDIAVIKVQASGLKPIAIGDSDRLQVGEWVLAIGSPLRENLARTVTQGIVSAKGRANVGLADYEDFIQTDAAINPGNSGGALVNIDGELVGINTAIASRTGGFEGIGFAVPSNMARKVLDELVAKGKVTRGYLGVSIQDIDEDLASGLQIRAHEGVLVGTVVAGGPAARAGIRTGDVILEINGRKVSGSVELRNAIAIRSPGSVASLRISRDGAIRIISVRLEAQPEKPAAAAVPGPAARIDSAIFGFSASALDGQLAGQLRLNADRNRTAVTDVQATSPAYRAGLRRGDIILSVDRKPVGPAAEFGAAVKGKKKGDMLVLLVERGGNRIYFAFRL
jgi:serine protease Do